MNKDMGIINVGDKIKMHSPDSMIPKVLCHIEAILADPKRRKDDTERGKVIVYRYYSKFTKRWYWKAYPYRELAIHNNWI